MSTEPRCFTQGDTVTWTRVEDSYLPADGWVLSYSLVGCTRYDITATDDGNGGHLVDLSAATTAAYAFGEYRWTVRVLNGPIRHTLATGVIEVLEDLSSAVKTEKTTAQRQLEHFEALLLQITAANETELENWRERGQDPEKILALRNFFKGEVAREKQAEMKKLGLGNSSVIKARFRRIGR